MATREASRQPMRRGVTGGLSRLWILVALLAVVVMATTASVQSGVLGTSVGRPFLALTIVLLFVMLFVAMRMDTPILREVPFHGGARGEEDALTGEREAEPPETDQVYDWRRMRLRRLGVPRELRANLAAEPLFSVHELERLLAAGCPLGTALRILRPD